MIEFKDITKKFGPHTALKNVSFDIYKNEIHSVIGENGAGKSTLLKILAGLYRSTSGQIRLNGQIFSPSSARQAFQNKIAMIHQHFMLAQQMTALENISLSLSSNNSAFSVFKGSILKEKIQSKLDELKWQVRLDEKIENLSVGDQQRVEILKALLAEPDILILDEPTAVLTPQETDELLKLLKGLKAKGLTLILVSHKLREVIEVSDRITVLRRGEYIQTFTKKPFSDIELSSAIIGHPFVTEKINKTAKSEVLCNVSTFQDQKLDLFKGEIFGVAGIEGHGQSELIKTLIEQFKNKKILYGDITEDRLHFGAFPDLNLTEHVLLKGPPNLTENFWLKKSQAQKWALKIANEWDVRPPETEKIFEEFSGGNQQKFIVGLELSKNPTVLIAAHPTRGVDLGAIDFIHKRLVEYARQGGTVLLVSSELDEILKLSDRFSILFNKTFLGPFSSHSLTESQIGCYMTQGKINTSTESV